MLRRFYLARTRTAPKHGSNCGEKQFDRRLHLVSRKVCSKETQFGCHPRVTPDSVTKKLRTQSPIGHQQRLDSGVYCRNQRPIDLRVLQAIPARTSSEVPEQCGVISSKQDCKLSSGRLASSNRLNCRRCCCDDNRSDEIISLSLLPRLLYPNCES